MAKLHKTQMRIESGFVDVVVHYFSDEYDPYFAVTSEKPDYLTAIHESLVYVGTGRTKTFKGTKGKTEAEALSNFTKYLQEWERQCLQKAPMLFIKIAKSEGENYYFRTEDRRGDIRQTGCKVDFMYFYGYRMEVAGKIRYFRDGEYENIGKDNEIYYPEQFVKIDATPELVAKCEDIIQSMNKMTELMKSLFATPEKAVTTLLTSSIKLLGS